MEAESLPAIRLTHNALTHYVDAETVAAIRVPHNALTLQRRLRNSIDNWDCIVEVFDNEHEAALHPNQTPIAGGDWIQNQWPGLYRNPSSREARPRTSPDDHQW